MRKSEARTLYLASGTPFSITYSLMETVIPPPHALWELVMLANGVTSLGSFALSPDVITYSALWPPQ
jgi:uncharacterized membrane protein